MESASKPRTLLDAINDERRERANQPALAAPSDDPYASLPPVTEAGPVVATVTTGPSRQALYWELLEWLGKRWDISDPFYTLEVAGVCSGGEAEWDKFATTATREALLDALDRIKGEDALLADISPWRLPIPYRYTVEEMRARD